jgi:hypothetical protein
LKLEKIIGIQKSTGKVRKIIFSFIFQGIVSPHDLAITQRGDAVYVVEVPTDRSSTKIHKYDVISNNNNAEEGSENNPEPEMGLGGFAF